MNVNVIEIKFVLYNRRGYESLLKLNSIEIKVTTEFKKTYICLIYSEFINLFKNIGFNTDLIKFHNIKESESVYFRINNKYKIDYLRIINAIPTITSNKHHITIIYGISKIYDGKIFDYDIRYGYNNGYFEHNLNGFSFMQLFPSDYKSVKKDVYYRMFKIFDIEYSLINYHYCMVYRDIKRSKYLTLMYERILHNKRQTYFQCTGIEYIKIIRKLKINNLLDGDVY
jgi:hypothetical protein